MLNGAEIECYNGQALVELKVHNNSIGGHYSSNSESSKMKKDYFAYHKMFKNFKNAGELDAEVISAFQQYFLRCLKKMDPLNKHYLHLYFLGFYYKIYVDWKLAMKIFITRNVKFKL